MDWKGLILLLLTMMSLHSSVFSCPEECECYHDINLYTANCSSFPSSNENELAKIEVFNLSPMSSVPLALKEGQFVGFKQLKYLSLSNCSIYYIHKKAFYGLKNLIEIDLSFNHIQILDPLVFQHNNDLTSLILRGNPIKFTANTPFLVSNTIQHLDLGLSSVKSIPRGVFFGVKKIMYMSLDGNRLQTLKYNSLPRALKYLNIANNMIINVPIELLTSLTNLHRLDLSGNPINCTCPLMDLQDWFSGRGVTFDNEVICASPPQYAGRSWNEVNEKELCITETLIDDMQKKPLKKITKNGLKNKEKYYFSSDKNKYLETSALQADEPDHFIDDKMDPNAEILFQNDDTLAMGEMMQDKDPTKTEKLDDKLENDTDGGDVIENDTNGSEVTVEDASKKTAFDDLDSDDPNFTEGDNENKEDKDEPVIGDITPDNKEESNKQHDTDNDSMMPSEDQLDIQSKEKSDEEKLQNDDFNRADRTEDKNTGESLLADDARKETEEKTKSDHPPDAQSMEGIKIEPIPVAENEDAYDKAASESLLTDDLISKKEEKQNGVEINSAGNVPNEIKENEQITEERTNEEKLNEGNVSDLKLQNTDNPEAEVKPNNKLKEEILENENVKEQESIKKQEIIKEQESIKEEVVAKSENENKHLSHDSALDTDLLVQEDLIETAGAGNKEENTSDIDSTEEPATNVDENNIDTNVIVDDGAKLEEKIGQIKAAESVDEQDKIENSDLKPEAESDLTPNENSHIVSENGTDTDKKDNVAFESTSSGTSNIESKPDEILSKTDNIPADTDLTENISASEEKFEGSESNNTDSVNAIIGNDNIAEEESVDKSKEQDNIDENGAESVAINKETEEIATAAPERSEAEGANVLTAVETESEIVKIDDTESYIDKVSDEKLGNLVAVNTSSEGMPNENEQEATIEPLDSKELFKSEVKEEMFIPGKPDKMNNTDYDDYYISTTQSPDIVASVEEQEQSELVSVHEVHTDPESKINETDSSLNDTNIVNIPENITDPTKEAIINESTELTTVSEQVVVKQITGVDQVEPEVTSESNFLETTVITDFNSEVTPGETVSGNDTNVLLVGTSNKPNADIKAEVPEGKDLQETEPFEFQEAHIVLACILVLVLALVLFSVYKCATNKNKSTKRITKDIESNHGTEMQDMASLLPKPSEDDNKSTKKYPEDASSNEKVKLITEDKEEDDNQYPRGNEIQAVVEKENTLNNNAPNAPNKPTPVNRMATPNTINPAAPIQRTKVKVAIIPESIPRTPIFVQKTYNNGVSTNG